MILSVGPFRPTTLAATRLSPNWLWGQRLDAPSRARGRTLNLPHRDRANVIARQAAEGKEAR